MPRPSLSLRPLLAALLAALPCVALAAAVPAEPPSIGPVPIDFILFALTLAGVALFHHHTLRVAVIGLIVITLYKLQFSPFPAGPGIGGLVALLGHEWVLLANLLGLLLGFALLSKHFEDSRVPAWLPKLLPDDWKGAFVLLVMIFVLSSFLDNIAAALIGGTIARVVFRGSVHIGYLAAIVAASNAGGSGSVVGDTTTTMMWIDGVSPLDVVEAYIAAAVALVIFGIPAARQQQAHSPIVSERARRASTSTGCACSSSLAILVTAIGVNVVTNLKFPEHADRFPFIGAGVWVALLACAPLRRPRGSELPGAAQGQRSSCCRWCWCASMMPVRRAARRRRGRRRSASASSRRSSTTSR